MQPYQKASEAVRRRGEENIGALKSAAQTAAGFAAAGAGGAIASKMAPFLNKYIPRDLAIKGLSKINPRLGKFAASAFENGFDPEEIGEFMQEKEEKSADNRNIVERYSPALHQFIDQQVKSGLNPIQAGAIAQNKKEFGDIIKKLSKEHKTPWSNIIESVYGAAQQPQPQQQFQNQGQAELQTGQQQAGSGQAAMMAVLQKIQQARGGQ